MEACTKQDWKTKTQNYVGRKGVTDRKGAGREVKIIKTHHTKFLKKKNKILKINKMKERSSHLGLGKKALDCR